MIGSQRSLRSRTPAATHNCSSWQRTKRWRISGKECDRAVMSARRSDVQTPHPQQHTRRSSPCQDVSHSSGDAGLSCGDGWGDTRVGANFTPSTTKESGHNRTGIQISLQSCSVLFCVLRMTFVLAGAKAIVGEVGAFNTSYCPME